MADFTGSDQEHPEVKMAGLVYFGGGIGLLILGFLLLALREFFESSFLVFFFSAFGNLFFWIGIPLSFFGVFKFWFQFIKKPK